MSVPAPARGIDLACFDAVRPYLDLEWLPAGATIVREGEGGRAMYFILEGEALVRRGELEAEVLGSGRHFGELALFGGGTRRATVEARTAISLARLTRERYDALAAERPEVARSLLEALVGSLGEELVHMTDGCRVLLRDASMRRSAAIEVRIGAERRHVRTGTPARDLLPAEVGGWTVVAALLDGKAVSLNTRLSSAASLAPLAADHWEGQRVFRATAGLVLLEAAARLEPPLRVRLGPTLGPRQLIETIPPVATPAARRELAALLSARIAEIVAADAPVHIETSAVEEACRRLAEQGSSEAEVLLRLWRDGTVPLATCGRTCALAMGPFLPSTGPLRGVDVVDSGGSLALGFGDEGRVRGAAPAPAASPPPPAAPAEPRPRELGGAPAHASWLGLLGVTSVGAFNEMCISGKVAHLIRVAEGFHEKRIGRIADAIAARRRHVRIICVGGPSSSGKTTFIKRLSVQLQIEGIIPVGISLDDYYVDRERTPRGPDGEYDYEAPAAMDVALLREHIARLLEGRRVATARYDFISGQSAPAGGPEIALGPDDVLVLEGIHGLNPGLLGPLCDPGQVFRIFIDPATTLRFDPLTRFGASDLRLIRRIVRDRFQRGYRAAENIARWPSVRAGERAHIFFFEAAADAVFDSSLIYEPSVLKVYAERYLLEVPREHPAFVTAYRLRRLLDHFVAIYPDHVPQVSILREFIGGSGFEA